LRKQLLIGACLAALAVIASVFVAARGVLVHSFAAIEDEQARLNIGRVRKALQADIAQLEAATADYAFSDDTYEFLQGQDGDFIPSSLTRATLDTLRVQVAWLAGLNGRTLVNFAVPDEPGRPLVGIPGDVLSKLQSAAPLLIAPQAGVKLIRLPAGVLAVSAMHVLRTDRSGPPVGLLLFGRYLDSTLAARLGDTSQAPVQFTFLGAQGRAPSVTSQAVNEWLALGGSAPDVLVQADGPRRLESHVLLFDISGRPLVVLSTSATREALLLGERTITLVVAALLVCFALGVVMVVTLLNRNWRTRAAIQRAWLDQQRKISRLARRDALTGLPNRLHLQKLLPRLIMRAAREGTRLALLYVDLDHFKNVNESLGHGSGDRLLTSIAERLRGSVAGHDLVVRMGGDEFLVVATLLPDAEVVNTIADRIGSVLAVPLEIDEVTLSISPSIGISVYPEDGSDPEALLKHADIALYHAKDQGRGNHQFYTPEMNARLRERLWLERELRQALERDQLSLEYQPASTWRRGAR
jgi:diguanylate cyclase (GGDEF)-like protein